jgi:ATP-dependent Clp protease ATP-binding subunit ClpA
MQKLYGVPLYTIRFGAARVGKTAIVEGLA